MKFLFNIYLIGFILSGILSCKKFVDVSPPVTQLVGSSVYSTDPTAAAAVTGIYQTMVKAGDPIGGGDAGMSALLGLSSDEFDLYPNNNVLQNQVYANSVTSNSDIQFWNKFYNYIYQANAAIEGLTSSAGVTPSMRRQLMGEVLFIRAFCHFYLLNIYGDVPLVLKSDYNINKLISRTSQSMVYEQIVADLKESKMLLSDDFLATDGTITSDRVRPNKATATALLARVYLYLEKWDDAEVETSLLLNNNTYQLQTDLNNAFLKNNSEAIWQLEPPDFGFNAPDAEFLVAYLYYGGPVSVAPFLISDTLINSFEAGDQRKTNWIINSGDYYFPYKYKLYYTGQPPVEYPTVFRLAEQYLIRAEARAHLNKLEDALSDLNAIRSRAGLTNLTTSLTKEQILTAIAHERQVELFTEYGHRWLDLKRTNKVNTVMDVVTPGKGGTWQSTDQLYPIPLFEIQADPNLTQNPGYN